MGWWTDRAVPRVVDLALAGEEVEARRATACRGLRGSVLELGFGSGRNVSHYPAAVEQVYVVEPSDLAWEMAQERRAASPVPIERVGLDGARVDRPDGSADHVLSTFTLCTIPDVASALQEVRRVLRPGGTFHFLEHGHSPDPAVSRWQHRLDGVHAALLGGCHLTLSVDDLLGASGLEVVELEHAYAPGLRPFGYLSTGLARKPAA
jgi:ubiquinone/menaquinone biosynthesis C-methylase UbiE